MAAKYVIFFTDPTKDPFFKYSVQIRGFEDVITPEQQLADKLATLAAAGMENIRVFDKEPTEK